MSLMFHLWFVQWRRRNGRVKYHRIIASLQFWFLATSWNDPSDFITVPGYLKRVEDLSGPKSFRVADVSIIELIYTNAHRG